jgi:hypothetical protein
VPGTAPGGGGGGAASCDDALSYKGGGGGGGGYVLKTYAPGDMTVGQHVTVTVGAGGSGGNNNYCPGNTNGGDGAVGRVHISWN